jgi:hypothetical protein
MPEPGNNRVRSGLRALTVIAAFASALAAVNGCAGRRLSSASSTDAPPDEGLEIIADGDVVFDGSLQELFPCHDGDIVAYRVDGGPRSGEIMVSRMFALPKAGDFRVSNSYGEEMTEALHLRVDGNDILVISQVDAEQDVGLTFKTPLPLLSFPLRAHVYRFRSPVRLWRPSNGRTMGEGEVSLDLSVREDSIEGYERIYAARQSGIFNLMNQRIAVESTAWFAPGFGEVRGERVQEGLETEVYTLVCAEIAGKDILDCDPYLMRD